MDLQLPDHLTDDHERLLTDLAERNRSAHGEGLLGLVLSGSAGRVRPYHEYLPWELREHPLPDWPADVLLPLLQRTLDGDPAALRDAFGRVEAGCAAYDAAGGHHRTEEIIHDWGDGLLLFRA